MNVYDFDETVYHGDSTRDFVLFLMRRHPGLWRYWPRTALAFWQWKRHRITKRAFKETLYRMFRGVPDMDAELALFWERHLRLIKTYYIKERREDDLIVSASPTFLLRPCCDRLGIPRLIASPVDPRTGRYLGPNCWGSEKVRRCRNAGFDLRESESFYSDSYSDTPLAEWAERAYLVQGDRLAPWGEEAPARGERLWHRLRLEWR